MPLLILGLWHQGEKSDLRTILVVDRNGDSLSNLQNLPCLCISNIYPLDHRPPYNLKNALRFCQ